MSFRVTDRAALTIDEKEELDRGQIPATLGEKLYRGLIDEDRATAIPVGASESNPVVLADSPNLLTSDQKAAFPAGASASNQIVLEDNFAPSYTTDFSTLGPEWTITAPANTSASIVGGRLRLHSDAGTTNVPYIQLNTPTFNIPPFYMQAYINDVSGNIETGVKITLRSAKDDSKFIGVGLFDNGFNVRECICQSDLDIRYTAIPTNPAGAWLRFEYDGHFANTFYSNNAEGSTPEQADWTLINTSYSVKSGYSLIPGSLRIEMHSWPSTVEATYDISKLTAKSATLD